ncbi:MAG TPA: dicarboxylate/amino acid:cation symporter, partial [Opitutae bacterium]|nr:dicarboxylate/amino acid:cation symporter [Opitutae bacterium]
MALHFKILISLALAFSIGLFVNFETSELKQKPSWFFYFLEACQFVGTLFLNALKMVVIPLIITSIICGVAKIGAESNFKKLGLKTFGFYGLSGILAVTVGLLCVNIFEPGIVNPEIREEMLSSYNAFDQEKLGSAMQRADGGWANLIEIFHRMVPTNLFKAAVEGQLLGLIFFSL